MKNKFFWLIVLIAAVIRLHDPLCRSLWGDEAHSLTKALSLGPNIISFLADLLRDSHLPSYFILLAGWIKLWGISEISLRSLSIVVGLLSIMMIFCFARELFGERTALIAALLLAFSPLAIMHSHEIRMYGLFLLLSMISSFYFWRLMHGQGRKINMIFYLMSATSLLLTHIYGVLFLASQFVYWLYLSIKQQRILGPISLLVAAGFLSFPLYWSLFSRNFWVIMSGQVDMAFAVFPGYLKVFLYFFVLTLGETIAPWSFLVVIPAVLTILFLMAGNYRKYLDDEIVFLLIHMLFPVAVAAIFLPPTMPKYLIISLPFFLLLLARRANCLRWGPVLVIILLATQTVSIANYYTLKEYHNSNQIEPWRDAAKLIASRVEPGAVVLVSTRFVPFPLMNYYLKPIGREHLEIYSLLNTTVPAMQKNTICVYDANGRRRILNRTAPQIWLVTHISDDRNVPAGYIENVQQIISKSHHLVYEQKFVPYEETLVAKLPIKRHEKGSCRIVIRLYQ